MKRAVLVANGDLRESANRVCWPAQRGMEAQLADAARALGWTVVRGHPVKPKAGHGFIGSQAEGIAAFRKIPKDAPLIVAEAVWQYTHHLLPGLTAHGGPVLTVANWSGQWPGLVGMLNLNGSLTKAGVPYATLWSEDFGAPSFRAKLGEWFRTRRIAHDVSHVTPLARVRVPARARRLGAALARRLREEQPVLGVFDEGCMGMFNAIVPDDLLMRLGVFKERLSQSALYHAATKVPPAEARAAFRWLTRRGMRFAFGRNEATQLTRGQVLWQLRTYIAALRIADEFGCAAIGIQYQQGLKDLLPASDLAEGLLNDSVRPPVRAADGRRLLYAGRPLTHFNEVDECAGLDGLLTDRVHRALGQPVENTLHDLRWGDWDRSGTTPEYVWVFEISGAVPPSHFPRGLKDAVGERQPPMYFRLGGSTIKGVSKPGEIVWSRIYVQGGGLHMDLGRAGVVALPRAETERRWSLTTPQWPIMHAVTYGVTRDQMMAKHQANHLQVAYARSPEAADACLLTKAVMARELGMTVRLCGARKHGRTWG